MSGSVWLEWCGDLVSILRLLASLYTYQGHRTFPFELEQVDGAQMVRRQRRQRRLGGKLTSSDRL